MLQGGTVVRARERHFRADVGISGGRIAAIGAAGSLRDATETRDVSGLHLFPGAIDPHVHIGFGGGMEEYSTDTRAAALGGVTSFFHILIDSGSYVPLVEEHIREAKERSVLDFGFHATLMTSEHLQEMERLRSAGVRSYKYFMSFRGSEGAYLGVEGTDDGAMLDVFNAVAEMGGVLMVHPENIEVVWRLRERLQNSGRDDLRAWNDSRPPFVEAEAIGRAAHFAAFTGAQVYFVHMSGEQAIDAAVQSRLRFPGTQLFVETCPHFLTHTFDSEVGNIGKVNPPLRSTNDIESLWTAIADGSVDTVASDHSGRRRKAKERSIWEANAGFPGLPLTLPVLLSEGYHRRGLSLSRIAEVTSKRVAEIYGIDDRKGDIAIGMDADLAIVDLDWAREVDAAWLRTYSDYSLLDGWTIMGWPRLTLRHGELVQKDGHVVDHPPPARPLFDA